MRYDRDVTNNGAGMGAGAGWVAGASAGAQVRHRRGGRPGDGAADDRRVGVEMRFDITRPGNSFDVHRLLHLALERGIQLQVKERFLCGYLAEGAAIGEHAALAVEGGLVEDEVRAALASDDYADAVRADEAEGMRLGTPGCR